MKERHSLEIGSVDILLLNYLLPRTDRSLTTAPRVGGGVTVVPNILSNLSQGESMRTKEFAQDTDVVFAACREVVGYVGWKPVDVESDELALKAITPPSWKSFGDEIEIQVSTEGGSTVVTVSSKPRFSLVNWGNDLANEGVFLEKLAQEIHRYSSR